MGIFFQCAIKYKTRKDFKTYQEQVYRYMLNGTPRVQIFMYEIIILIFVCKNENLVLK